MKCALVAFGNEESYGLLFVGGELLRRGDEIRFFDAEMQDIVGQVVEWAPEYVLFSPLGTFFPAAAAVCEKIRERLPGAVTVFGGHHATSCPEIARHPGVDIVVVGPVRGAMERILAGERSVIKTDPTVPGDLPLPARKEFYRDVPRMAGRYRKIMLSMLGCPWNCTYCNSAAAHLQKIFGAEPHRRYYLRRRHLDALLAEAGEITKYPTAEIEWVDDDFFYGNDVETWLPQFAAAWAAQIGLPLYVSTTSHNALKVSDTVLSSMRKIVNCVGMGVQAVRPDSLKLFNRSWDNEAKMKSAYDRLVSFGYAVNLQCIVGLPVADPVEDALETVKALQRIGPGSVASCYPLQIYPGSAMERYCRESGFPLNEECSGDTSSGIPGIRFPPLVTRRIRNICKLSTMFVKYGIEERWMRALIDIDIDESVSRRLSTARYYECVTDRLREQGEEMFSSILGTMNLRY